LTIRGGWVSQGGSDSSSSRVSDFDSYKKG